MISGKLFRDSIINGAVCLENRRRQVDELNVYPVPDGDTGTNMSMTINSAKKELMLLGDDVTVSKVADTAASAMLRGARGNSGVILSIIFRGFSKAFKELECAECVHFSNALELGADAAYKAVMKPAEGTILTVSRMASQAAQQICNSANDISVVWGEVCRAASDALAKTPDMLPVLKKSGVVDAGGQGLVIIFEAMLEVFRGGAVNVRAEESSVPAVAAADTEEADIKFTYCTECIITKSADSKDPASLRAYLETIGDCVLVVDDDDIIKVHVHTNNPGNAIEKALEYGYINLPKIENMKLQHDGKKNEKAQTQRKPVERTKPEKKFGFVAVAARDTEFDGKQIKKGEIIALDNSKLAFSDKDIIKIVLKLVKRLINADTSYVTLIYGADVTDENAEKMQKLLSQKLSDKIEVMLVNGGQPVYYYIISVE